MPEINQTANYLATRLCHDLAGPISAINNGMELLADESLGMQEDAIELITASAKEAVNRLQYYRMAYGHLAEGGEQPLGAKRDLMEAFFGAQKIKLQWEGNDDAAMSFAERALALHLLMVAAKPLIRGGTITIEDTSTPGKATLTLSAEGPTMKLEGAFLNIINRAQPLDRQDPKGVQLGMMFDLAAALGGKISASKEGETGWRVNYLSE